MRNQGRRLSLKSPFLVDSGFLSPFLIEEFKIWVSAERIGDTHLTL